MQNLTITVAQTFFKIVPLIGVFLAAIFSYAFVGNILFSNIRTGEEFNFRYVATCRSGQWMDSWA